MIYLITVIIYTLSCRAWHGISFG